MLASVETAVERYANARGILRGRGAPRHPPYLPSRAPMLAMAWDRTEAMVGTGADK